MLPPQIFTVIRDWPRLPSEHPTGERVKTFNCKNLKFVLKFVLKFSVCASITSGLVWVSSQNFCRRRAARQGWRYRCNFWKARHLKFGRAKTVHILAGFLIIFDFDRECLRNGPTYPKSEKKTRSPKTNPKLSFFWGDGEERCWCWSCDP